MTLARLLTKLIRKGSLTVIGPNGTPRTYKGADGPSVTIRLRHPLLPFRLFLNPPLAAGEGYMDGTLTVESGTLYDFLDLIGLNLEITGWNTVERWSKLERLLKRLQQFNPAVRARRNVAHHYDLSGAFYELFLDSDRQYSCAYFLEPHEDLETAQENKKRHIASKLVLKPGQRVLDIGCGWGGLALHLAKEAGVEVTALTLSREQLHAAQRRARDAGLADRVRFYLRDYREEKDTYDRIVSVGMFEHVGVGHYPAFFQQIRDLLTEDGVALLHTIGRADGPGFTNAWIRKYIFPGGYSPAMSEIVPVVEDVGLWITDVEVLRLHYAETLRHWRTRFLANRARAVSLYDERFARMWEYYLVSSEVAFRYLRHVVFQFQIAKSQDSVPLVRDYITDGHRSTRIRGKGARAA